MAILTVTATTNYTGTPLNNITEIDFSTSGPTTATFASNQFGSGHISNSVNIVGDANTNNIVVNLTAGTFSAAGWTLTGIESVSINGTTGVDTITGSPGNDTIRGGESVDNIFGGNGNDTIICGPNDSVDNIDGGAGIDTVDFSTGGFVATIDLAAGTLTATGDSLPFHTLANIENVSASNGPETILGSSADNILQGNDGNDTLNGRAGADTLTGGRNSDKFVFDGTALTDAQASPAIIDRITDYDQGDTGFFSRFEGDQIDLSALLSAAFENGQPVSFLVRLVDDPSGAFVILQVDPDGTVNGSNFLTIARLDGVHHGDPVNVILDASHPEGALISSNPPAVLSNGGRDFNADGINDLLLRRDDGIVGIDDVSNLHIGQTLTLGQVGTEWHIAGIADFSGDHHASDILWQRDDGTLRIDDIVNNQVSATAIVGQVGGEWRIVGIGDFNGDGTSDIVWQRGDGTMRIYDILDNKVGATPIIGQVGTEWHFAAVGDFNGDGTSDFLWRRDDGTIRIDTVNNNQVAATQVLGQLGTEWHLVAVGDFNGDRTDDLAWRRDDGTLRFDDIKGTQVTSSQVVETLATDVQVAGVGDYNRDGFSDLLLRHDDNSLQIQFVQTNSVGPAINQGQIGTEWHVV